MLFFTQKKDILIYLTFFFISFVLRIYRITELTEFLGDQGREGIVIFNWFRNGIFPILGPPVSTGEYLGPFFYYLIAPSFILFRFNPVAPAIFMSFVSSFTPLLLFYLLRKLYNFRCAILTSLLYATSPILISQERTLWNPTLIPFFSSLFLVFCYKFLHEKKVPSLPILGIILSVLLQLHYSNIFFILIFVLINLFFFLKNKKQILEKKFFLWSFLALFSLSILLAPFIFYETSHRFPNTSSVVGNYIFSKFETTNRQSIFINIADVAVKVLKSALGAESRNIVLIFGLLIFTIPLFLKRDFWQKLYLIFFLIGIFFVSFLVNNPPDHYVRFLIPFLFLLIGSFISTALRFLDKKIVILAVTLWLIFNLSKIDIFKTGVDDIKRTGNIVSSIISETSNIPFSFTLLSSRSFSDLHYRYFFTIENVKPESIENDSYNLLFLVCDNSLCPTRKSMEEKLSFQVLCYDPLCDKKYPEVSLSNWSFKSIKSFDKGQYYIFEKRK